MKKIRDIQKKHPKHVDVRSDTTSEEHIEIHRSESSEHDEKKDLKNISLQKDKEPTPNSTDEKSVQTVDDDPTKKEELNENADKKNAAKKHSKKPKGPVKIVFMGTGYFAGHIIEQIAQKDTCEIVQIVTQPDKKIGRKKSSIHRTLAPNPVRDFALEKKIPLFQPIKLDDASIQKIIKSHADMIVVAAYGRILPKKLLDAPKFGAINVHASLLPQLRGASPAQNALLLGLKETGVTIMQMDEGLDTGDVLAQKKISIEEHERSDELLEKLSILGADLLIETAPQIISEEITPQPQDHSKATLCQLIDREDGHIQWTQTTQEVYDRFRALHPWPGIFSYWEEKANQMMRIKWRAIIPYTEELTDEEEQMLPGTVFIGHDQLCIKTLDGAIIVEALQPECKVIMPVYDFLNGHKDFKGSVLR